MAERKKQYNMTEEQVIEWLTAKILEDLRTGVFWQIVGKKQCDEKDGIVERQTTVEVKDGMPVHVVRDIGSTTFPIESPYE